MDKIFFLLLMVATLSVGALDSSSASGLQRKKPTKTEIILDKIEYKIEASDVLGRLKRYKIAIEKGRKSKKPISIIKYTGYCAQIDALLKYRWFIADTGLSRKWLKSIKDLLVYMRKTQDYIEVAKYNRNAQSDKCQQAIKYLDVAYKRFVKLIEKPSKVSLKSVRSAKAKKVIWQKAMRKKYKIKSKIKEDF